MEFYDMKIKTVKYSRYTEGNNGERELFSNAILNLLLEEEVLSTSGKTLEELFERVYENVVQEKEIDEVISVETTFEQLCRNPGKRIITNLTHFTGNKRIIREKYSLETIIDGFKYSNFRYMPLGE